MSDYYPVVYAREPESSCSSLLRLAAIGAVVGGSAAAASSYRQVKHHEIEAAQAIRETAKAATATGAATALAGAAASAVADQGLLRLGVMFVAGAAALYGINQWLEKDNVER
jgi:hypothetical protein